MSGWVAAGHVRAGVINGQVTPAGEMFLEVASIDDVPSCEKCQTLGAMSLAAKFLIHLERSHKAIRVTIRPDPQTPDTASGSTTTEENEHYE